MIPYSNSKVAFELHLLKNKRSQKRSNILMKITTQAKKLACITHDS